MLEKIYIILTIIAYIFLAISLIGLKKKGSRSSIVLISAIIFSMLALSSFNVITECQNYDLTNIGSCENITMTCIDEPLVLEGLGFFNGGMAVFSFIMFLMFVFNQTTEGEEWA